MGENMKKIFLILCGILFTTNLYATQMCARRDTTVVPLDSVVDAPKGATYPIEWMWKIEFSYGNVYGATTCLSENEVATLLPSDSDDLRGRSGTDADGNIRDKCYCKMNHPMSSLWVINDYQNNCTKESPTCGCQYATQTDFYSLRTRQFVEIGYGYETIDIGEYDTAISLN